MGMKKIFNVKQWLNRKAIKFTVLPAGVKDISDIFASQAFKDFKDKVSKEIKPNPKPLIIPKNSSLITGEGRSYLEEYFKTLPILTADELNEGKADGRMVAILDVDKIILKSL